MSKAYVKSRERESIFEKLRNTCVREQACNLNTNTIAIKFTNGIIQLTLIISTLILLVFNLLQH
jgi:hypothetical protein